MTARYSYFYNYFNQLDLIPTQVYQASYQIYVSRIQQPRPSVAKNTDSNIKEDTKRSSSRIATRTKNNAKISSSSSSSHQQQSHQHQSCYETNYSLLSDEDKQCKREIRTFYRAALSELCREKKCAVFNKPVDPELVIDYYDVVKCPMDLDTMRMKVSRSSH